MPTPLVLFDLDNTLVDRAAGFSAWARTFVAARSIGDPAALAWLERLDDDGLMPRADFFAAVRERFGLPDPVDALVAAYRADYPQCMPPLAGETASALVGLRAAGWKIGIASNGAATQETKITLTGLDRLVDGWAISEPAGVRKPDPALFRIAAGACEATLRGGWMVGDSAEADIAGAVASELSSVWISRGRAWTEPAYRPTLVADSVGSAVAAIVGRRER